MFAVGRKTAQWGVAVLAAAALATPAYAEGMLDGLGGVKAEGYVEAQYNYNINEPQDSLNAYRIFDWQANTFTFNMAELALTKSADNGVGFGLVLNYGSDAQVSSAAGSAVDEVGEVVFDDFDVQQAYVSDMLGPFSLKFGKFATLAGAEVIEGPGNANISRSFLFGWAIPFTHTGLRAGMGLGEGMSVTLGVNNGWDSVRDLDGNGRTIEAQVAVSPSDMLSVAVTGYYGPEDSGVDIDPRGLVDVLATVKLSEGLTLGANYDRGRQSFGPNAGGALWHGYALYGTMGIGDKHSASLRAEYFDDHDGFRTGLAQTLQEVTLTGSCKMKENLEWRAEVRHDRSNADVFTEDDGSLTDSQTTVAVAAYYSF